MSDQVSPMIGDLPKTIIAEANLIMAQEVEPKEEVINHYLVSMLYRMVALNVLLLGRE